MNWSLLFATLRVLAWAAWAALGLWLMATSDFNGDRYQTGLLFLILSALVMPPSKLDKGSE